MADENRSSLSESLERGASAANTIRRGCRGALGEQEAPWEDSLCHFGLIAAARPVYPHAAGLDFWRPD